MKNKLLYFLKENSILLAMMLLIVGYVFIIRTGYPGADAYIEPSDNYVHITAEQSVVVDISPLSDKLDFILLSIQHPMEPLAESETSISLLEDGECIAVFQLKGDQYYEVTHSAGNATAFTFDEIVELKKDAVYTIEFASNTARTENAFGMRLNENGEVWYRLVYEVLSKAERQGVTAFIAILLAVLAYVFVFIRNREVFVKPENFFLVASIVLCTLFLIFVPIFQVPDEYNHYVRAYGITKGYFLTPEGGNIPVPYNLFPYDWNTYSPYILVKYFSNQIDVTQPVMFDNVNMALYSPISYILQVIGIGIADIISNNTYVLVLAGSVCNIIGCTALLYFAIKYIPYGKGIVTFVSLLPMAIQERASLSVDAVTYAGVVALLAFCLYKREQKDTLSKKQIILMYSLIVLVTSCKVVYFVTAFVVLLIPRECFENRKKEVLHKIASTLLILVNSFGWLAIAGQYLSNTRGGGSTTEKIQFMITSFGRYLYILGKTFFNDGEKYLNQMIGSQLGSLNISINAVLIVAILIMMCNIFCYEKYRMGERDWVVSALLCLICIGTVVLIATSLYIQWTDIGASTYSIEGIQGRYFLPILPIFLCMLLSQKKADSRTSMDFIKPNYILYILNLLVVMDIVAYTAEIR